jgi:hypothetical protein
MRYIKGFVGYYINVNRQNFRLQSFSKPSKNPEILHFLSKTGGAEIFSTSAVRADL